jgi:alpha-L-fucosidase 2
MTGALRFEARVRVRPEGGTRRASGDALIVRDADAVTLFIAAATSYRTYDDVSADPAARVASALDPASRKSIDALRAANVRDYQRLFNRVTLDLGASTSQPTAERVRAFGEGTDPGLAALYFQYGRYLLIASSRAGSQPATLQGLWNESMSPPWGSKYTININTEMNYWPALSTNLAETMDPLTAMVSDLSVTGARTAREMYGADGWVAPMGGWRITTRISGAPRAPSTGRNMACGRPAARGSRCRCGTAMNTPAIATISGASTRCSKVPRNSFSTPSSRNRCTTGS